MAEALEYARFLSEIGVNAIIVQDMGFLHNLRRVLPEMKAHASTQMTAHNLAGVEFLQRQGVERVILAREVSLADLREISARTDCELEVFVHGALCICYSGQCLLSSLVGGRSGNRGRCAQPCRMRYSLERNGEGRVELAEGYLLSPRDLNALALLPDLQQSGVKSLKIEGRMKKPEYVATVVRIYRQALDRFYRDPDSYQVSPEEQRQLAQIFNRDFTTGYFEGHPGSDLMSYKRPNNRGVYLGRVSGWDARTRLLNLRLESDLHLGDGIEVWVTRGGRSGLTVTSMEVNGQKTDSARAGQEVRIPYETRAAVGDRVFKTFDQELDRLAKESYTVNKKRITLVVGIRAAVGEPLMLWAVDPEGCRVEAASEHTCQLAEKHPLTRETAEQQLGRLGNTPFTLASLDSQIDPGVMVPLSVLNSARRSLIESMERARLDALGSPAVVKEVFDRRWREREREVKRFQRRFQQPDGGRPLLSAAVGDRESARQAVEGGADQVYLPEMTRRGFSLESRWAEVFELARKKNCKLFYSLPRIWTEENARAVSDHLDETLERYGEGLSGILAPSIGSLKLALEKSQPVLADYPLNIFSPWTLVGLMELGASQVTLSLELNQRQLSAFAAFPGISEIVVHGSIAAMVSEQCLLGGACGERTRNTACTAPCTRGDYCLKDRLGLRFPIETDRFCRMYLYNSRTLDLLENLGALAALNPRSLRLEIRRLPAEYTARVVEIYRREIDRACESLTDYQPLAGSREAVRLLTGGETTRGHLFRGVD